MSKIDPIEFLLANRDRRDEAANVELAVRIVAASDTAAMSELTTAVSRKEIASDAIKVLYEVAERKPELAATQIDPFLELLRHKSNRIVWGAMTAVDAITEYCPDEVAARLDELRAIANSGSVITRDHFVSILVKLSATDPGVGAMLLEQFDKCPPNQLPMYAERGIDAIRALGAGPFVNILRRRVGEMKTEAKKKRIEKVLKQLGS